MEDKVSVRIRRAVCDMLSAVSGAPVPLDRVKPADTLPLGTSAFVYSGDAKTLLPRVQAALPDCVLDGLPLLASAEERNGWLLFDLSDAWWERLCVLGKQLPDRDDGSYLCNRLAALERHGDAPCPRDPAVRRALWLCTLGYEKGAFSAETERAVLTMTHHLGVIPRTALLHACGGVAKAMRKLKGGTVCS